jgi:hypothetical protein
MRPPAGWDARVKESSTRWAWSKDAIFPLEESVLPNVFPGNAVRTGTVINTPVVETDGGAVTEQAPKASFVMRWGGVFLAHPGFACRLLVLVLVCWVLSVMASLVPALLPFILGRAIFFALRLPSVLCHDPFAYFVGNFAMQRVIKCVEYVQNSVYGRLSTLVWNWQWQRFLPPSDTEDDAITRSRVTLSPRMEAEKKTAWSLAREVLLGVVVGWFLLPFCIGLAFNACLQFRPLAGVAAAMDWFQTGGTGTCSASATLQFEPLVVDLISLLVQAATSAWMGSGHGSDASLLMKELIRTLLLGQMVMVVFVALVLSRHLKTVLATVGIPVLRADTEGPLSSMEEQEEAMGRARRAEHWLMRWYLMCWEDACFADLVKKFEWDVDYFTAVFVRSSPGTVMQNHLVTPRHLSTAVTTLTPEIFWHHTAGMVRSFNQAFVFAPRACWFVQYILGSYSLALLFLYARTALATSPVCSPADETMGWFIAELNIVLPLLIVCAVASWLDDAVSLRFHLVRGWDCLVGRVHRFIKDDYYLIGKELQNSVEVGGVECVLMLTTSTLSPPANMFYFLIACLIYLLFYFFLVCRA